jgi:hypothetical protein
MLLLLCGRARKFHNQPRRGRNHTHTHTQRDERTKVRQRHALPQGRLQQHRAQQRDADPDQQPRHSSSIRHRTATAAAGALVVHCCYCEQETHNQVLSSSLSFLILYFDKSQTVSNKQCSIVLLAKGRQDHASEFIAVPVIISFKTQEIRYNEQITVYSLVDSCLAVKKAKNFKKTRIYVHRDFGNRTTVNCNSKTVNFQRPGTRASTNERARVFEGLNCAPRCAYC